MPVCSTASLAPLSFPVLVDDGGRLSVEKLATLTRSSGVAGVQAEPVAGSRSRYVNKFVIYFILLHLYHINSSGAQTVGLRAIISRFLGPVPSTPFFCTRPTFPRPPRLVSSSEFCSPQFLSYASSFNIPSVLVPSLELFFLHFLFFLLLVAQLVSLSGRRLPLRPPPIYLTAASFPGRRFIRQVLSLPLILFAICSRYFLWRHHLSLFPPVLLYFSPTPPPFIFFVTAICLTVTKWGKYHVPSHTSTPVLVLSPSIFLTIPGLQ